MPHTVTAEPGVPEEILAFLRRAAAAYARQDPDSVDQVFTEDAVYDDHRPIVGSTIVGREKLGAQLATTYELLPDFEVSVHVLASHGEDLYLARDTYVGHTAEGGGEATMEWWVVDRLRDGLLAREDIYETEAEARAAFEAAVAERG